MLSERSVVWYVFPYVGATHQIRVRMIILTYYLDTNSTAMD